MRAVEDHALVSHKSARPAARPAAQVGVEKHPTLVVAELDRDAFVRAAAAALERVFSLGVVPRGREKTSVVHRLIFCVLLCGKEGGRGEREQCGEGDSSVDHESVGVRSSATTGESARPWKEIMATFSA